MRPKFRVQQTSYRIVTFRAKPKFVSDCRFIIDLAKAIAIYSSLKKSHDWDGLAFIEVIGENYNIIASQNLEGYVVALDGNYKILPLSSVIHESFAESK